MLYIYVITKEGEDYWISDKVWVVLSNNIDISHRSELSSLFSSDNAVDNIRAPPLTHTVRPHHRFLGNIKSQLAPLNVLIYRVLGGQTLNGPDIPTSRSVLLEITATAGDVFSSPLAGYLKVLATTTVSTVQASFVTEVFPVDLK